MLDDQHVGLERERDRRRAGERRAAPIGDSADADTYDLIEATLAEALEQVEEIAVEACPVCGEHPHVS